MSDIKEMTYEEWKAEGVKRFGERQNDWNFVCPVCGHIASIQDYIDAGAPDGAIGFSCIGRWKKGSRSAFDASEEDKDKTPCDYSSGGLICVSPIRVTHDGKEYKYFNFAEVGE